MVTKLYMRINNKNNNLYKINANNYLLYDYLLLFYFHISDNSKADVVFYILLNLFNVLGYIYRIKYLGLCINYFYAY